ncbi:hypothetical protein B0F87_106150 [Methylobacter tundripaludum]|uniref:Uncharacterized protein n=2 Tax=Methylobacter tundripaludum TaxID=173365 RepID=A0A2S6HCX8_9GAMM|nr:hypothetical protein B0F87_106150 [Methylobacter tundripaludum]
MFGLQELFDKKIEQMFQPHILGVRILENELGKIGITINDKQRSNLENQFKNADKDSLIFNFSDDQLEKANFSSEEELKLRLQSILDNFGESIKRFSEKLDETMEVLILSVVDKMALSVNSTLEQRMMDMLEDQEAIHYGFGEGIHEVWGNALGLLQGLIVISDEAAQGYLTRSDKYSNDDIDIAQDVLLRIHAKSNQIAKEILTLLRSGFADGAQARWRSLHELAVVSCFIAHHGDEVAVRYIEHEAVEIHKASIEYNKYYIRLGATEISQEEMSIIKDDYDALIEKYGKNYGSDYGWASEAMGLKKPTFRDIELAVELDHYRPYYKAASANIHANPAGVLSRLGLFPEEDILLAGPSNIGLCEPAQSTIISLTQITTSLLTYNANIDFLVVCKAMSEYGKKAEKTFIEIERKICEQRNA